MSSPAVSNSLTTGGQYITWIKALTYPAPMTGVKLVMGAATKALRVVIGWAKAKKDPIAAGIPLARIQKMRFSPATAAPCWTPIIASELKIIIGIDQPAILNA